MSEARKHIGELLAFFQKSGRRCLVIWERTHEDHEHPQLEVGINPEVATADFFRSRNYDTSSKIETGVAFCFGICFVIHLCTHDKYCLGMIFHKRMYSEKAI